MNVNIIGNNAAVLNWLNIYIRTYNVVYSLNAPRHVVTCGEVEANATRYSSSR